MKSIVIHVQPDLIAGPGYAQIVTDLAYPAGNEGALRFSVQRNQDGKFLANHGQWVSTETWHLADNAGPGDQGLVLKVGPAIMDPILSDTRVVCRLQIQVEGGQTAAGVMRLAGGLYPSNAARAASVVPDPEPHHEPEVAVAEPAPVAALSEPAKKSKALPILLLLLLLALIGAGLWWYLTQTPTKGVLDNPVKVEESTSSTAPKEPQTVKPEPATPAPATTVEAAPCSVEALQQSKDEFAYLQACTQSKPSTEQIVAIIAAGKKDNRCDLIQRLYAYEAQQGNTALALQYAREFDPPTFKGGCFKAPDIATAIYWYELVLQQQPDNQDALERIKVLKEKP